jgi:hypothetical protein
MRGHQLRPCAEVLSDGRGHSLRNRNHPIAPAMTRAKGAGTLTSISKPSKIATTRAIRNANTGLSRTPAVMIDNCAQGGRLLMAMSTWY